MGLIALIFLFVQSEAQTRKVFAIIIGISNYSDQHITELMYAHRDAECFSTFLRSEAGGNVPQENIIVLLNDQATWTAMYDAMDKVQNECNPGDLVYFYFSGHGDVENEKAFKQGYLISYNTPRFNYTNRALRIMDLNEFANTLSTLKKVKTIIITDACHSGSLTTQGVSGTFLAAAQLKEVVANEVRLSSCKPDQLSMEDKAWGGGRSVFSYYLLNGLMGLADKDDGKVTLDEMKNYLTSSLSRDSVLRSRKFVQTPVVDGLGQTTLAMVDKATLEKLKTLKDVTAIDTSKFKPLPKTNSYYFFELYKSIGVDDPIPYDNLLRLDANQIPEALIDEMIRLQPRLADKLGALQHDLRSNPDALKRFQTKLVDVIESSVTTVISLYEEGDEAELERRRYYNSLNNSYGYYAVKLALALKLTPKTSLTYNNVLLHALYFGSVALRLKSFHVKDDKPLLDSAFQLIQQALQVEDNAAYLHHEMGILYQKMQDYTRAKEEYQKAIRISPRWSLPYQNLAIVLNYQDQTDQGLRMLAISDSLKPKSSTTSVCKGILYGKKKNLLASEEHFRRAIFLNSRHYLPFEMLGFLYLQTNDYALADSFFLESEKRKQGFNFRVMEVDNPLAMGHTSEPDRDPDTCLLPMELNPKDVMGHFVRARMFDISGQKKMAKEWYEKTLRIQPDNPLAYHYLALQFYEDGDDQRASRYFLWAQQFGLRDSVFREHCKAWEGFISGDIGCVVSYYVRSNYNLIENYYRAGESFQRWKHYSEAIEQYQQIILQTPKEGGGYYKLWSLQDSLKRFNDEEVTIQQFSSKVGEDMGFAELANFYQRVTTALPNSAEWLYKAGCFHYRWGMGKELSAEETFSLNLSTEGQQMTLTDEAIIFATQRGRYTIFELHGENKSFRSSGVPVSFHARAIWYLEQVLALIADDERSRDVMEKLGDLYAEMHSTMKAAEYYRGSLNLQTENASLREKLIAMLKSDFVMQEATSNMDTLWQTSTLSFMNLLFYSNNLMKKGSFLKADSVLQRHQLVYPFTDKNFSLSQIRLYYMSERWKETSNACLQFQKTFGPNEQSHYTLARTACRQDNVNLAFDELEKAIQNGFRYYWILKYDPVWDKLRKENKWNKITSVVSQPLLLPE